MRLTPNTDPPVNAQVGRYQHTRGKHMQTFRFRPSALGGLLAAFTFAAASAASAHTSVPGSGATGTAIYGIALYKPFTAMPECPFKPNSYPGADNAYTDETPHPCFEHADRSLIGTAPAGTEMLDVMYPVGHCPEMYTSLRISLIEGIVHGVYLLTPGVDTQLHDYAFLEYKFGKPQVKRSVTVQDRMRGTYQVIKASWQRPGGVSLSFTGAADAPNAGEFTARTPQEGARQQAQYDQQQGVPKL